MPQKMVVSVWDCLSAIADENTVVASNVTRPKMVDKKMSNDSRNAATVSDEEGLMDLVEFHSVSRNILAQLSASVRDGNIERARAFSIFGEAISAFTAAISDGASVEAATAVAFEVVRTSLASEADSLNVSSSTSRTLDMERNNVDPEFTVSHVTVASVASHLTVSTMSDASNVDRNRACGEDVQVDADSDAASGK